MNRSWVTSTTAPSNSMRLSSSTSREVISRSFVGSSEHEPGDEDAGLLAARKIAHGHVELIGREEESLGPGGDVDGAACEFDPVMRAGEGLPQSDIFGQFLALLVEDDDAQAVGQ